MERRRRIAVMLTPVDFGGAERVCMTLLKNIHRDRLDIVPILLTRPWVHDNIFVREIRKEGYDPHEIPVALKEFGDYLRVIRCGVLVRKLLKEQHFDLLHTHGYFADIVGIPVARTIGLPIVSTCHGYVPNTWNLRLYNAIDRFVLRFATRILAVSEGIRQGLVDSGVSPDRIEVVANAVSVGDGDSASPANRSAKRKLLGIGDEFVVGYIGRLSKEKGLTHLLAACADLLTRGVPLKAVIVGDGPQEADLKELSRRLGLVDRVVFAGFQEDIAEWLPSMDVFVLPSLTEGTPMALLEAMAHGVPTVASAVGGVPQVIEHGKTGLLVAPGQSNEIVDAIDALYRDRDRGVALARSALDLARTRYGIPQWIDKIEAEYKMLCGRPKA